MQQFTGIGLGEILWDVLPDTRMLGGAPANFAYHMAALGGIGIPVSRMGNDDLARETLAELKAHNVPTDYIALDSDHPTGTVNASLDKNGVATYTFPDDVAWDFLTFDEQTIALAATADAICFGTLAQRSPISRKAIHTLLRAAPNALKIYDINLRQDFFSPNRIRTSLAQADILKINDDELTLLAKMFCLPKDEHAALTLLIRRHDLKLAVLTRGGDGSLLVTADTYSDLPGQPTKIRDTIGAGDSFTAALTLAYLHGKSLDEINRYATKVAAYVCGQAGAMPTVPAELRLTG